MCYLTEHGRYIGRFEPALSKNALLRSAQYRATFDAGITLALARQMVRGKLANMRVLLQRTNRDLDDPAVALAVDQLKTHVAAVEEAPNLEHLRGLEGAGSATYFGVFDTLLKPSGMRFVKRVRRPPTDPVNSLLSFGYALLANDIQSAVNTVGFDPYQGFLHVEHYGRPSLALDLMEEFRPLIVDSVVLTCVNKRIIGPDDFSVELGQVHRLTDTARRKFLMQYEERKTYRDSPPDLWLQGHLPTVLRAANTPVGEAPQRRNSRISPLCHEVNRCTWWFLMTSKMINAVAASTAS